MCTNCDKKRTEKVLIEPAIVYRGNNVIMEGEKDGNVEMERKLLHNFNITLWPLKWKCKFFVMWPLWLMIFVTSLLPCQVVEAAGKSSNLFLLFFFNF